MSESEWTKILGWPGYRVYRSEINEAAKTLRLWVRRKRGPGNFSFGGDEFATESFRKDRSCQFVDSKCCVEDSTVDIVG